MGRRIPDDNLSLSLILHPVLYLSFLAAGLAASIAIVTGLCSVLFWKKPSSSLSKSSEESKKDLDASPSTMEGTVTSPPDPQLEDARTEAGNGEMAGKELPLPPAMQQPNDSKSSANMKRAASERRMSFNLSIKMPRTLSVARLREHHKEEPSKKMKGKPEDSVWMKTIILGEKCQVPEDEEEAVIYERKGKKVSAYHPKSKSTMSSSHIPFVDSDDALQGEEPKPQNQEEILNKT